MTRTRMLVGSVLIVAGCGREEPVEVRAPAVADVVWSPADTLTEAEIEAGRLDDSWREALPSRALPTELGLDTLAIPERWGEISELPGSGEGVEAIQVPLGGRGAGPSVLYVQILLDRLGFSPGILDGRWGKNTEKAVYWFQDREGLPATGILDEESRDRLYERAGRPPAFVREYALTESDLAGPFVDIPSDVYELARLRCSCYEFPTEKLAERFHVTPETLRELNPGLDLDELTVGDPIRIPDLERLQLLEAEVARIVISGEGFYLHALDDEGQLLYHFPTTLGSRYDPSPLGVLEVVSIHPDPWFHYQPWLLAGGDPSKPSTRLPPGPNNLVGDTWIKLSEPHYGIHGTRDPQTIGYATSSGCVRLTNWDAAFLRERIRPGVKVEFEGTRPAEAETL
jgi:peptidoglycan hydrolase-like protein with peptidoglycan-binding domain